MDHKKGATYQTVAKLLLTGALLIIAAIVWHIWLPLNKKLWTSSYVLYTSAIDLMTLGILLYFIEIRSWKKAVSFFSVFGKNPLFIYILSTMMGIFFIIKVSDTILIDWVNEVFFQKLAPGPLGALLFSLCYTFVCWCIGWVLDKRKIYIRL